MIPETDHETGEYLPLNDTDLSNYENDYYQDEKFDMETGEPSIIIEPCSKIRRKKRFNIPKNLLPQEEPKSKCYIDPNENFTLSNKEKVITLQEEIILGYNKTSHRLFFLITTTLALFTRVVVLLAILLEIAMHAWAHKKNAQNLNPQIYYRSPLHELTERFCTKCRHEQAMNQVIKMQDQRQRHWQLKLEKLMNRTIC